MPSIGDAAGAGGGPTRFGYRAGGLAIPTRPEVVVARLDALERHASALPSRPRALVGREPVADAVAAAVDLADASAFASVAGANVYVGVDASAARTVLSDRGGPVEDAPDEIFEGEDWAAAAFDDVVVATAAPRVRSARARRQYVRTVRAAGVDDGERLLSASRPARVVVDALPAGEYLDVAPALSTVNFRSEAFGASVRGDRTVLARSRISAGHVDPSKRNARLDTVDGWRRRLAPDASVDRVSVEKDGRLVRVTGVVDTSALDLS